MTVTGMVSFRPLILLAGLGLASCAHDPSSPDAPILPPPQWLALDDGVDRRPVEKSDPLQLLWAVGDRVFFAPNSDVIDAAAARRLTGVVLWFNQFCAGGTVLVEGHTDDAGDEQHNMALSRSRALTVARFLLMRGTDVTQIDAKGFGATQPAVIAPWKKDDLSYKFRKETARAENRRAVVRPKHCPGR